jgi:tRNA (uracil-5-)-methyltransferase TRM9
MNGKTVKILLDLNREFYQTFASNFSATRMRLHPGVKQILKTIPSNVNILDLGCGNGKLAQTLAEDGYRGKYFGVDFSPKLLGIACKGLENYDNYQFIQGDLSSHDWDEKVYGQVDDRMVGTKLQVVFSFATFHHLPGNELHLRTLQKIRALLTQDGKLFHSTWQFLNSERLRKRIQPWAKANLASEDVDPGDYLLDWRQGGLGLRYVHYFSLEELNSLADQTGFVVEDSYFSDGEGENLGLYQVWKKM